MNLNKLSNLLIMINIPFNQINIPINQNKQITTNQVTKNQVNGIPDTRRFWPVPPMNGSVFQYQNVNKDVNLRKQVTKFFYDKVIKWINKDEAYSKHKDKLVSLQSIDGQIRIYQLLRQFIKKSHVNWYDLKDNYSIVKDYLNRKL